MIKQTTLALAALAIGASAQSAQAAEASKLSVTLETSYVSDYVFRGVRYAEASIQPSVEATYGDFYAGIWHTSALSDNAASGTETDLYAGYGFKINDTFSLDAGLTRYAYNGGSPSTDSTEVYIGVKANVLLSPSLYYYYDFDGDYSSLEASIGYSLPIEAIKSSLDFTAKLGYILADENFAFGDDNFTYGSLGVAVPYKLSDSATLTVGVDYIYKNEDNFTGAGPLDSAVSNENDAFIGKVSLSIGF
jgi:uncharacterized protein (TIGR02001 family)